MDRGDGSHYLESHLRWPWWCLGSACKGRLSPLQYESSIMVHMPMAPHGRTQGTPAAPWAPRGRFGEAFLTKVTDLGSPVGSQWGPISEENWSFFED